jgi:hypothetical protein
MYDAFEPSLVGALIGPFIGLILIAVLWSVAWKGYALWLAARNGHKWWFIALLLINTLAILEIIYIFAIGLPEMKKRGNALSVGSAN